jgi:hypothetical protein
MNNRCSLHEEIFNTFKDVIAIYPHLPDFEKARMCERIKILHHDYDGLKCSTSDKCLTLKEQYKAANFCV